MFTAPIQRAKAGENGNPDAEDKEDEKSKAQPGAIVSMLKSTLTVENIEELGFIEFAEIEGQFKQYLSGDWEAGYGGLPRCLRICLLTHSLLILKQRFGVKKWQPDADDW
jgi:hypothetical protein